MVAWIIYSDLLTFGARLQGVMRSTKLKQILTKILAKERDLMTTVDFITELYCRVDEKLNSWPKHSQASLYPSEVVTLALLYALSGKGQRAFWRWLSRDYRALFPELPERTRLFRLFNSHRLHV